MEYGKNSSVLNKSGGGGTPQRKKPGTEILLNTDINTDESTNTNAGIGRARRGVDGEQREERDYNSALQLYGNPPTMDIT